MRNLREEGIVVPASGLTQVTAPGGKCVHGVYIPSSQIDQDYSEFCTVCLSDVEHERRS